MVALELRFVQEKAEDGQLMYRLDPYVPTSPVARLATNIPCHHAIYSPIDTFVTYDGKRAADIAVSRYAVRSLVAAEVHLSQLYAT